MVRLIWASKNVNYLIFGKRIISKWCSFSERDQEWCKCSIELQGVIPTPETLLKKLNCIFWKKEKYDKSWDKINGSNRVAANYICYQNIFLKISLLSHKETIIWVFPTQFFLSSGLYCLWSACQCVQLTVTRTAVQNDIPSVTFSLTFLI